MDCFINDHFYKYLRGTLKLNFEEETKKKQTRYQDNSFGFIDDGCLCGLCRIRGA